MHILCYFGKKNNSQLNLISHYKSKLEKEIEEISNEVLNLVDEKLLKKKSDDKKAEIFYQKLKGDYNRYLAEIYQGEKSYILKKIIFLKQ